MLVLTGLDHLCARVADIDAAASAYARLLGRRPCWRGEQTALGVASARFALANTVLELQAPLSPGAVGAPLPPDVTGAADATDATGAPAAQGEGLSGLAFRVENMDAALKWAADRGLAPGPPSACLERDIESGAFREWVQADLCESKTRGIRISLVQREAGAAHPAPETSGADPAGETQAAYPADPAGAVHALDHVVVQSADVQAAKALYGEALGLRLALEREAPQWGAHILFFRCGGVTVEVTAPLAAGERQPRASGDAPAGRGAALGPSGGGGPAPANRPRPGEGPDPAHDRFYGAAWRVNDAAAAHARLAAADIPLSELRPGRKPGTRVFTVKGRTCGVPTLVIEAGD